MATRVTTQLDLDLAKWNLEIAQVKRDMKQMTLDAKAAKLGDNLAGEGGGISATVGRIKEGFAAIAAPLAGVFAVDTIRGVVNEFDRLGDLAARLGVTAESLQRVDRMATLSGTSLEPVVTQLMKVQRLVSGGDVKAMTALRELGIDAAAFAALSPERQIAELAAGFQTAQEKGQGFSQLAVLMGKNFGELVPLLRSSREELDAIAAAPVVSEATIQRVQAFNDRLDALTKDAKALTVLALDSAPALLSVFGKAISGDVAGAADLWEKRKAADARAASDAAKEADARAKANGEEEKRLEMQKKQDAAAKINAATEEKKAKFAYDQLTAEEKLEDVRRRIAQVNAAASGPTAANDPEASARLQAGLNDLLQEEYRLRQQISAEQSAFNAMVDAENRAIDAANAKKAEDAQKDRQRNAQNAADMAAELEILKLRAAGKEKAADAAQREADIAKDARSIQQQLGVDQAQALAIARETARLKEQIAGREERGDGGRRKIRGANQAAREAAMSEYARGGLDAFYEAQRGPSQWDKLQAAPSQWDKLQAAPSQWDKLQAAPSQWEKLQMRAQGDKNAKNARRQDAAVSIAEGGDIIKLLHEIAANTGTDGLAD